MPPISDGRWRPLLMDGVDLGCSKHTRWNGVKLPTSSFKDLRTTTGYGVRRSSDPTWKRIQSVAKKFERKSATLSYERRPGNSAAWEPNWAIGTRAHLLLSAMDRSFRRSITVNICHPPLLDVVRHICG